MANNPDSPGLTGERLHKLEKVLKQIKAKRGLYLLALKDVENILSEMKISIQFIKIYGMP